MASIDWAGISLIKADWTQGDTLTGLSLDLAQKTILELIDFCESQKEEIYRLKFLVDNQENQITTLRAGISI